MPRTTAILLIAHGSRHEEANAVTRRLAEMLAANGEFLAVVPAFLELAQPDINAGATECVSYRPDCVILLPHFLTAGTHVLRDLTAARERLAQRFTTVDFLLAEPIGVHSGLAEILAQRACEAIEREMPGVCPPKCRGIPRGLISIRGSFDIGCLKTESHPAPTSPEHRIGLNSPKGID